MDEQTLTLTGRDEHVGVAVVLDAAMNYALAHNGISPLKAIIIENGSTEPLSELMIEITLTGPVPGRIAEPLRSRLPEVPAGQTLELPGHGARWQFDTATFAQLDEAVTATVGVHVFDAAHSVRMTDTMRLLARDEWWAASIEESLAAFVTPRARAVQDLLGDASDLLGTRTGDPSLQGYQGGADRAMAIAGAIYDAMGARQIRYINPPASFEGTGQKIRPAQEVLVDRWGTCLDLATTYAAALEHAGLHPVLVLCDGHAFAGHLLEEQQLPELVLRDRRAILNYVETGLFVPAETVGLCAGAAPTSFAEAVQQTRQSHWWAQDLDGIRCLIDVAAAHRAVRPLPAFSVAEGVRIVEVDRGAAVAAAAAKPAAAVAAALAARGGGPTRAAYPPRVDRWRSSLLDLSFRNPLLNMKIGRTALELHVPQGALPTLEDLLFEGQPITLVPHDQLAQIHRERGARTAQDIEASTLTSMLTKERGLFCACTDASYVTRLRGIQRRARTVTEETGANNLFLTLGMLEWEDNKRQAKAPLFLLPVTLRAQRGRGFSIQIEDGGYPQPNQCLLEKLRIAHGLSIPQFREPESDDSGIDLAGSLQAIRRALLDAQLPFSVEESAHLSLLQFSTLQLWQDLSENWETFLQNPVVRHMVQTPTDSFAEPPELAPVRMPACSIAAATSLAIGRSTARSPRRCSSAVSLVSAAITPGSSPLGSSSRRVTPARASSESDTTTSGSLRKISGRMNGTCWPRSAFCRLNRPLRRLALRLARMYGLSRSRGSTAFGRVHCQVPASPVIRPGQPFSSTRKIPLRARTRTSTSLTVPSTRNSKFAHALNGS